MNKGILFIVFGEKFYNLAIKTISYSRNFTNLPFHVLTNVVDNDFNSIPNTTFKYFDLPDNKNRFIKTQMFDHSPFRKTLYIDCDAVIQKEGIEKAFDKLIGNSIGLIVYGTWYDDRHSFSYYRNTLKNLNVKYPLELFYGAFILFNRRSKSKQFFAEWHDNWLKSKEVREMPALACTIKKGDGKYDLVKIKLNENIFAWKLNTLAIVQHEYGNGPAFWEKYFKENKLLHKCYADNDKRYRYSNKKGWFRDKSIIVNKTEFKTPDYITKKQSNNKVKKYKWSIGMPSYNNYVEVYFTVQALRMYHDLTDCEIIVVDNYGDDFLEKYIRKDGGGVVKYHRCNSIQGVSHAKNKIFEFAKGEFVLVMDSHILVKPGALDIEIKNDDLYQGPLFKSNCEEYYLEWLKAWRANMWGIWADPVEVVPDEPKEIWAMGAGFFACRRSSWLGFNKNFKGFGGETGYLQEKYRKAGRKVWMHPKLIWQHLFCTDGRKFSYPIHIKDRIRNYIIGFEELGLDLKEMKEHFGPGMINVIKNTITF